jgi:3-methyl-2-oxobutanoate hydroxymethyltransferase
MSVQPSAPTNAKRPAMTMHSLMKMYSEGEKITMLTAYDASFAALADLAGVEVILVGDSLGMVCQGHSSTLPVTLDAMRYHTECVARGVQKQNGRPIVLGDMPFGTYATPEQAFRSASELMQAGAHMVKLEGGAWLAHTVEFLVTRGIPVCGHVGLTPQSVNTLGGYRVQGRTESAAHQLQQDALQLQNAGAQMLVMEMVPAVLSAEITRSLTSCATIGIGAGVDTAGQILVLHDMLGVTQGKVPKFAHNFMGEASTIQEAMHAFVRAVKEKRFPVNELHAW